MRTTAHTPSPCLAIHPVRAAVCATLRHTRWRRQVVGIGLAASVLSAHGQGFAPAIDLSALDGTNGFEMNGVKRFEKSGESVSKAGDVNGDGIDDLIIGATGTNVDLSGTSYVVFGKNTGFDPTLELSVLDGTNGFAISGAGQYDLSGTSVSNAGDVNGDGIDDLIIGAKYADRNGNEQSGASYVVFGKSTGFGASLNLSALDGSNGFAMNGVAQGDRLGRSVSGAGDVNGDGIDDVIIGAYYADPNGNERAGKSYVVFGNSTGFSASLDLSALDGTNGFAMDGVAQDDRLGRSVSGAGDVNGDGVDDLIIGAHLADPNGIDLAGTSYVVFGKSTGFSASLDLSTLDGTNGFALNGTVAIGVSGFSVSGAGDVNGDGVDDLIIGARGTNTTGNGSAGTSYVVFGQRTGFGATLDLSTLDGSTGFALNGAEGDSSGFSVSDAGDVNDDTIDDLIIGAPRASPNGDTDAGKSYLLFGKSTGFSASVDLSTFTLNGSNGFVINGEPYTLSSTSVSSAGDVNGDGVDDLIIGAPLASANDNVAGRSYVVFGRDTTPNAPYFSRVSQELEQRAPITKADITAIAQDIAAELQITLDPAWVNVVKRFGASDATNLETRLTPLKQRADNYFLARQRAVENGKTLTVWKQRHAQLLSIRARRSLSPAEAARLKTAKDQISIRTVRQTHWKKLRDRHNLILQNNLPGTEIDGTTVSFPYQRYLASLL